MRKLLSLGAGAAIVGIILLVIAFAVSYVVVAGLQTDLAASLSGSGTSTLSLTYATLEAVFLAVMIALGYGLITKGLDGVRRQEQMERGEVWAEPLFSQPPQTAAATTQANAAPQPAQPAQSRAARPSMVPRPRTSPSRVFQGSRPVQLLQTRQSQSPPVVAPETKVVNAPPPPPPVVVVVQAPPQSSQQANVVEVKEASYAETQPASEEAQIVEEHPMLEVAPEPVVEPPTVTTPLMEPMPTSDVKWEGGEPEMPPGVEILPEPERHRMEAPVVEEESPEEAAPMDQQLPTEAAEPTGYEIPPEVATPVEQVEPPPETVPPVTSYQVEETPETPAPPVMPQAEVPPPEASPSQVFTSEDAAEKERARLRRQARRAKKQQVQSNPAP